MAAEAFWGPPMLTALSVPGSCWFSRRSGPPRRNGPQGECQVPEGLQELWGGLGGTLGAVGSPRVFPSQQGQDGAKGERGEDGEPGEPVSAWIWWAPHSLRPPPRLPGAVPITQPIFWGAVAWGEGATLTSMRPSSGCAWHPAAWVLLVRPGILLATSLSALVLGPGQLKFTPLSLLGFARSDG